MCRPSRQSCNLYEYKILHPAGCWYSYGMGMRQIILLLSRIRARIVCARFERISVPVLSIP
eukprot:scaffold175128_cov21-Prasinocladus_malaysianus.AAC.1